MVALSARAYADSNSPTQRSPAHGSVRVRHPTFFRALRGHGARAAAGRKAGATGAVRVSDSSVHLRRVYWGSRRERRHIVHVPQAATYSWEATMRLLKMRA